MVAATVPFSENCTQAAGVGTPVLAVGFSALMLKGICTVTATYPAPHPRGRVTSAQFFNGSTAKIGIETDGQLAPARQHDVMRGGVIVGGMRERTDQRPFSRQLRELRKVLANLDARYGGADRTKFTTHLHRGVRLHVEAFVLRQSAGEKDINDRLRPPGLTTGPFGGSERLESGDVIHAEAEESNRSSLNGGTARYALRATWL